MATLANLATIRRGPVLGAALFSLLLSLSLMDLAAKDLERNAIVQQSLVRITVNPKKKSPPKMYLRFLLLLLATGPFNRISSISRSCGSQLAEGQKHRKPSTTFQMKEDFAVQLANLPRLLLLCLL
jgi:hypothetical protein